MNSLWIRNKSFLPSSDYDRNYQIENLTKNCSEYSSHVYFDNTPYTLSFGQLLSGNSSCSYERPKCYNNTSSQMYNLQSQTNTKINEAMKTIRKTVKQSCDYSIPTVPYCYNSIMNQNNMTKAAILLEQAANVISIANNKY